MRLSPESKVNVFYVKQGEMSFEDFFVGLAERQVLLLSLQKVLDILHTLQP